MSIHIGAAPGEIAASVLICGDPLRARYVADKMLTDARCYNEIRGMLGFTGLYLGKRVSVQGTGIGIPSTAIYLHELIHDYGVQTIVRIGTCGAIHPELELGQLILATAAYTHSHTHLLYHEDMDVASMADDALLDLAAKIAQQLSIPVIEGPVFSTDIFYSDDDTRWDRWKAQGVLGIEMETSILYAMAAKHHVKALSILSVSDNILTGASQAALARAEPTKAMMALALAIA